MSALLPTAATITAVSRMTADTTLFTLNCRDRASGESGDVSAFLPGQFLEFSLPGMGEVPISYCGLANRSGTVELCIRHVGHVTLPLLEAAPGDAVGLRGPFGRGFPLNSYENRDLLLIAGGLGMAPLRSLLLSLLAQRGRWGELTLLYGAKEAGALLFLHELLALSQRNDIRVHLAVGRPGDGRSVPPGCRIALLPELLDDITIEPGRTYAVLCGPPVVYPLLAAGLKKMGVAEERIHLSLERRMKCGMGRCGHCAVGMYLCCTDGPVFSCAELHGIEGALA